MANLSQSLTDHPNHFIDTTQALAVKAARCIIVLAHTLLTRDPQTHP
jgi:hypothetical protein